MMSKKQHGFTIIELLIAMAVFSVVLLMVSYAILSINRVYYKGLTSSSTQETARAILQDVSQNIQFNGGIFGFAPATATTPGVLCLGSQRYTFKLNQKVDDTSGLHGLVADEESGCDVLNEHPMTSLNANETELLIPGTRLGKFDVTQQGTTNLFHIKVQVVYGDDDLLVDADNNGVPDLPGKCKTERSGGQFCAVSELSTIVQKRL